MYPPPPAQLFGSPTAPGPDGLEQGVSQLPMFQTGEPPLDETQDVYANLDRAALLKRFEDAKKDGQDLRWVFERQWWRNMLYTLGRQWIFFDVKRNEWRDKRLKKWMPKPVTNKVREVQVAIRSMFAAVQLGVIVRPNGNDPQNIATANTADQLQPLLHEEHRMDEVMRLADVWMCGLGNVFLHPWWNPDEGEVQQITEDTCPSCGATQPPDPQQPMPPMCPQCQVPMQPKTGDVPTGRGTTDVVSPFEIFLPSHASTFRDCEWVIRLRWRPKAYWESHYPDIAPTLTYEKQPHERSLHLFKALASQNDLATVPFTWGSGQRAQAEGLMEYEYWEKPNALYPKGLFFRVIGEPANQILEDEQQSSPGPIPVETINGEPLWPWIHIPYETYGGRLWASSAIDSLIEKQNQLNQVDAMFLLHFQRMSNSGWTVPKGSEIERFDGEPGLVIKYNLIGTSGAGKPEKFEASPIPAGWFQYREQLVQDIEELAGTYDILKGNKPTGVEAFSALQLLVERSQSRFTAAFAARGEGYQEWFRIALELERKYGPVQRTQSLMGPNGEWTFQTFQKADLLGNISVVVEDGTNVPKTALGKRAAMEQANNLGFVNPQDPDQKHAFLSEMGLSNLMPGLDAAKKSALRQQDEFEQWVDGGLQGAQMAPGQPDPMTGMPGPPQITGSPLVLQPWDDPRLRLNEFRKWANSDKLQTYLRDPKIGQVVGQVLSAFFQQLNTLVMQMQAAMAPPPPEPGHGPGGGQAMSRSNANSTKPDIAGQPHGAPVA